MNKCGKDAVTPLHSCAGFGRLDMAKLLLAHGADETMKDDEGDTPTDYAREFAFEELARLFADMKRAPIATRDTLKDDIIPGHAAERAEKAAVERAKQEALEKKIKDAEKERLRKEREAKDARELAALQQKRKEARIELSKLKK